jgi:hypothetical protein
VTALGLLGLDLTVLNLRVLNLTVLGLPGLGLLGVGLPGVGLPGVGLLGLGLPGVALPVLSLGRHGGSALVAWLDRVRLDRVRLGLAGLGLAGLAWRGFRVGHGHGKRVLFGVGARLLMWRPRAGHGLARDLEEVHQFRPRPDRRALPGLRRVLDELEQARIALAMAIGLDPHAHAPASDSTHKVTVVGDGT